MTTPWTRLGTTGAVIALGIATLGSSTPAQSAPATGEPAGEVVVVDLDGNVLPGGDSQTEFSLRLPEGAACQGDSEEGQYRVQSFLVPAAVDPGTLEYRGLRPQTEGGWALYELDTTTFMNRPTAKAESPGGPGEIINVPGFSFAVFEPGMIPLGRAHLGLACSLFAETTRFWSTEVEVAADAADPAGLVWTVVDPAPATGDDERSGVVLPTVGLMAVAGAVALRRRSKRTPALP